MTDDTDLDARAAQLRNELETARADATRASRRADRAQRNGDDPTPARAAQHAAEERVRHLTAELAQIAYARRTRTDNHPTTS